MQVIRYKTAQLFEASARLAAILCEADLALQEDWAAFGRHLGTAFQLIDDVLDYSGVTGEIGKNVGDDLREGKATLPLIYLLAQGTAAQQQLISNAITDSQNADLPAIQREISNSGALEYTRNRAREEAAQARAIAERLPDSPHKDSLLELCAFAVARDH
jgi:octaprenyl-diphosphate synthase